MKRRMIATVVIVSGVMLFSGCGNGLYEIISRDQGEPDNFYVKGVSFSEENKIRCSWGKDERSDRYILMRSEDKVPLAFEKV